MLCANYRHAADIQDEVKNRGRISLKHCSALSENKIVLIRSYICTLSPQVMNCLEWIRRQGLVGGDVTLL